MALAGPSAAARLIALDTSAFIYLIEKHPTFFSAVEPIFQAVDAGTVQAATSVLTLLEVLVRPLEANAIALANDFRAAVSASANLRVIEVDRSVAELAASIRATYGYRNLTLLRGPLNAGVSNGPFVDKQAEIVRHSLLALNLFLKDRTTWDLDSIAARGAALFEHARVIWPHPSAQP
jgi:predicted nucleic acid-binding protein